jgi:hypothetical protein
MSSGRGFSGDLFGFFMASAAAPRRRLSRRSNFLPPTRQELESFAYFPISPFTTNNHFIFPAKSDGYKSRRLKSSVNAFFNAFLNYFRHFFFSSFLS